MVVGGVESRSGREGKEMRTDCFGRVCSLMALFFNSSYVVFLSSLNHLFIK